MKLLVAVKAQTIHRGDGNTGTSTVMVKLLLCGRSMSWKVFHSQFEATIDHSGWEAQGGEGLL
jgi:hypothetical protein